MSTAVIRCWSSKYCQLIRILTALYSQVSVIAASTYGCPLLGMHEFPIWANTTDCSIVAASYQWTFFPSLFAFVKWAVSQRLHYRGVIQRILPKCLISSSLTSWIKSSWNKTSPAESWSLLVRKNISRAKKSHEDFEETEIGWLSRTFSLLLYCCVNDLCMCIFQYSLPPLWHWCK